MHDKNIETVKGILAELEAIKEPTGYERSAAIQARVLLRLLRQAKADREEADKLKEAADLPPEKVKK